MRFSSAIMEITQNITGNGIEVEGDLNAVLFPNAKSYTKYARKGYFPEQIKESAKNNIVYLKSAAALPNSENLNADYDYVMLNPPCVHGPDPISLIGEWSKSIKNNGKLFVRVNLPSLSKQYIRPLTSLEHIYGDYLIKQDKVCDEHLIASKLNESPNYFPSPDNIRMVLEYMWLYRINYIDAHCRNLLLTGNMIAVEKLLGEKGSCTHHVFDIYSFMQMIDLVNSIYDDYLVPCDILLNEECLMLVLRKYDGDKWKLSTTQNLVSNDFSLFRRLLGTYVSKR